MSARPGRPGAIPRQGCTQYSRNLDPDGYGVGGRGLSEHTPPPVDSDSVLELIGAEKCRN